MFLKIVRLSEAPEAHSYSTEEFDDIGSMLSIELGWGPKVIVIASPAGVAPSPAATLKPQLYCCTLKIVAESMPAKVFELEINPENTDILRVSRVLPKARLIDRWEARAGLDDQG